MRVTWSEILFGSLLAAGLLAMSLYYGWRQFRALRQLKTADGLPDDEHRYERRKAYRRLVMSALTLLIGLLIAVLLAAYDSTAGRVMREREGVDPAVPITPEQRALVKLYVGTWIGALVALFVVLVLAGLDLLATRQYGLRQYRKLAGDRRAMIQRQAARLRGERNGDG